MRGLQIGDFALFKKDKVVRRERNMLENVTKLVTRSE